MQVSAQYFNSHTNINRVDVDKWCGVCRPDAINAKDERAYALAMERNRDARRNVKVSLEKAPWE